MNHSKSYVAVPTNRHIFELAIPALGTLAAEPLMGLVDTALVGHLGSTELATLGAANTLLGFLFTVLIFLEYGTTARLSRRFGAGEIGLLVQEAIQMGWLATGLGLLMTNVLFFFPHLFLRLLNAPPEVLSTGATYLSIRALGGVPGLWIRVGNGIFRGLQDTKTPLLIVVGMNLLNALLATILIFGWPQANIPAFRIAGAAWATVISTWVGGIAFLWAVGRKYRTGIIHHSSFRTAHHPMTTAFWPRWEILRDMLAISRDLLLRTIALQAALFTGSRMAAGFGTASLAAHQVGWQLWIFLALLLDSLAIAGQSLVGKNLGAGRAEYARSVGNRLCLWGLGLGTMFCFGFLALRGFLPRIFSNDPIVLSTVDTIFGLLAGMQVPNSVLFVLDGLLIGASDMIFIRNATISLGILGALSTWLGGTFGGNLKAVWLGITVFMLARLVVMGWRWKGKGWIQY
jgi:putative MATE family efflux protein